MKGILLIAAGHPYYGKMAVNLALGLKNTQPDVNITLAYESTAISHLNANERALFNLIEIPKEYYHRSGILKEYIKINAFTYKTL